MHYPAVGIDHTDRHFTGIVGAEAHRDLGACRVRHQGQRDIHSRLTQRHDIAVRILAGSCHGFDAVVQHFFIYVALHCLWL